MGTWSLLRGEGGGPGRHLHLAVPVVQVHSPWPQMPSQPTPAQRGTSRAGTVGAAGGGGTVACPLGSGTVPRGLDTAGGASASAAGSGFPEGPRAWEGTKGREGGDQKLGDLVSRSAWKTLTRESLQDPLGS